MTSEDIWFSGPVKDAVSLVAQRNCVFLLYVYDESEKANTLNATLKDEQVTKAIKEHTVALSMEKSSENAIFFGQFYPIQSVPIIYFIKQGTIRDFGIETISSQEIVEKINQVNGISTPIVSQQQQAEQSQQPIPAANPVPEQSIPSNSPSINNNTSSLPSTIATAAATANVSSPTSSPEEIKAKNAELQKQLEQVRKEHAEREKQEAQDREIKRRQEAKLMQEAKQDRKDKENKVYFDKLRKEKMEDEAHRKRVRQQIATDRAEKIAQRNAEKERKNSITPPPPFVDEKSNGSSSSSINHESSNLNIRQLNGTNIRNKFEAANTLSTVREWIKQNRTDDSRKAYKLSSQFPTRLFTEADDDTTLSELNLCPSATIIMKPIKSTSSIIPSSSAGIRNGGGGIIGYATSGFDFIYGFIIALINMLTGFFATLFPTSGPAPHELPGSQQQQPILRNLRGGQRLGSESAAEASSSSSSATAARKNNETLAQKRNPYATHVNTLHEDEDMDDDEKRPTYNGNSVNHE